MSVPRHASVCLDACDDSWQILVKQLLPTYIGVHLRVESDMYATDEEFDKNLPAVIAGIKAHRCMSRHTQGNLSSPVYNNPVIYVASGLFTTNQSLHAEETPSSLYRVKALTKAFNDAHLQSIVTKLSTGISNKQTFKIYAEQHAYTDLLILSKATCFIPAAPVGSSLSYVVERFRDFQLGDYGGDLKKIRSPPHMNFHSWGF